MILSDRFWVKVDKGGPTHPTLGTACWVWSASTIKGGYGNFWDGECMAYAHRLAYEAFVGPIPPGMEIDHLCRRRNCVRPDHLEAVSPVENFCRGVNKGAAMVRDGVCHKGHDTAVTGVYVSPKGARRCLVCSNERGAAWASSHKEAVCAKSRKWQAKNRERYLARMREYARKRRAALLDAPTRKVKP